MCLFRSVEWGGEFCCFAILLRFSIYFLIFLIVIVLGCIKKKPTKTCDHSEFQITFPPVSTGLMLPYVNTSLDISWALLQRGRLLVACRCLK